MAESDTPKPAGTAAGPQEDIGATPAPAASVPEAPRTPDEDDGDSSTQPPDDDGSDDASAALTDWSAGRVILDDYVVDRELGAGGMGKVYLLRSRSTGQPFAVKRAFLRNEDSRRNFLAELRTWIDLPEHPHLVACRFFRTVGDEVAIFAEFVEGGSLADWIRDRRLTRLEQILDVAIQFAWGLHAAHELGLVHQDVKPGNALMTGDGMVKVADFGLARARAVAVAEEGEARSRPDVTGYSGTRSYQSPEQAAAERLTPATDVWSWGLAVLEVFSGERFWPAGVAAPWALEAYLKRPDDPDSPAMPNEVAQVLQKCFRRDPSQRWESLAEAGEALQRAYRQALGKEYPRPTPAVADSTRRAVLTHNRRTTEGRQWDDPREWLIRAFKADGRNLALVAASLPPRAGSRKAQAIADLAAYEEARCIFEHLVTMGRKDLEAQLANLCLQMALVHRDTDNMPGAVAMYDRAIAVYERLVEREGRLDLAGDLARACANKAIVVTVLGDKRAAVAMYDRTFAVYERLVEREGWRELAGDLAKACMNKAIAVHVLGDHRVSAALCDRAIGIFERLVDREGWQELADALAKACIIKGEAASALGDKRAAVAMSDRTITIFERLVEAEGRRELADGLAMAYMSKANALNGIGDKGAALAQYDRAIAIYDRLVHQEGRQDLARALALVFMNKAVTLSGLGDNRAALVFHGRAVAIYERLVEREGRRELAASLALACMNKANALRALGDHRAAVALYDRAVATRERLVEREGRRELQGDLAWAVALRARSLLALGDLQQARSEARQAVSILKAEIARTGRADLQKVLDDATKNLQELL